MIRVALIILISIMSSNICYSVDTSCKEWIRKRGAKPDDKPCNGKLGVPQQLLGGLHKSKIFCGKTEVDGEYEYTHFCKNYIFSGYNRVTFERINQDPFDEKFRIEGHRCKLLTTHKNGEQHCNNPLVCHDGTILGVPRCWQLWKGKCLPVYNCKGRGGHQSVWSVDKKLTFKENDTHSKNLIALQKAYIKRAPIGKKYHHGGTNNSDRNEICGYMDVLLQGKSLIGCIKKIPLPMPPIYNIAYGSGFSTYVRNIEGNFYKPTAILVRGDEEKKITMNDPFQDCENNKDFQRFHGKKYCVRLKPGDISTVCVCEKGKCRKKQFIGCGPRKTPDKIIAKLILEYNSEFDTLIPAVKPLFTKANNERSFWNKPEETPAIKEMVWTYSDKTDEEDRRFIRPEAEVLQLNFQAIIPQFIQENKPSYRYLKWDKSHGDDKTRQCSSSTFLLLRTQGEKQYEKQYLPVVGDGNRVMNDKIHAMCKNTIMRDYNIDIDQCPSDSPSLHQAITAICPGLYKGGSENKICLAINTEWEELQKDIDEGKHELCVEIPKFYCKHHTDEETGAYWEHNIARTTEEAQDERGQCLAELGFYKTETGDLPTSKCIFQDGKAKRIILRSSNEAICKNITAYNDEHNKQIKLCPSIRKHSDIYGNCLYQPYSALDFLEIKNSTQKPKRLWSSYVRKYKPKHLGNDKYVFTKSVTGTQCNDDQYSLICKIIVRRKANQQKIVLDDILEMGWDYDDEDTES